MRLSVLCLGLALGAPLSQASAQFFEGQSVLFGRRHGPQAPWCSYEDTGGGNVTQDCSFRSFEECRRIAIGVNNTFCMPNPAYDVSVQPVRRKKGDRLRRR
jgi:hypothetical protein